MRRLLITRPRHDPVTEFFYAWSEQIISAAERLGWLVDRSEGEDVTRKEVQSRLKKRPPALAVFNGHGTESTLEGARDETILDETTSHLLKDTVSYVRSCSCLTVLGKSAVKQGCRAFIGYKKRFRWAGTNGYEARPLQDPAAKPVLEASNVVPIQLLKGDPVREAVESSHRTTMKYALRLAASEDPLEQEAFKYLILNDFVLNYEGDGAAHA
jgi:hypothetical protein